MTSSDDDDGNGTGGTSSGSGGTSAAGGTAGSSGGGGTDASAGGAGAGGASGAAGAGGSAAAAGAGGAAGGAGGAGGVDPGPAPACVDEDLESATGQSVAAGDNSAESDDHTVSCGLTAGPDRFFRWYAERSGRYVFDTFGSDHDTSLEILDGCPPSMGSGGAGGAAGAGGTAGTAGAAGTPAGGAAGQDGGGGAAGMGGAGGSAGNPAPTVLGCNDRSNDTDNASIPLSLEAGESVVVIVEGNDPGGNYQLNVTEVTCPETDLGSATGSPVTMGNSATNPNVFNSACGAGSWPDATFKWTAPSTGTYSIDLTGTSFAWVLDVLDGEGCDMPSLGCTTSGPFVVDVEQDDVLTIIVDAVGTTPGDFVVAINEVDCMEMDLMSAVGAAVWTGDTTTGTSIGSTTCGGSGPEKIFTWTAPADGSYTFDTIGSSIDTVLEIRDGGCAGSVLACNDEFSGSQSSATVSLTMGQVVTVVVDSFSSGGAAVLNITQNPVP